MPPTATLAFVLAQLIGCATIWSTLTQPFEALRFGIQILLWVALVGCGLVLSWESRYCDGGRR